MPKTPTSPAGFAREAPAPRKPFPSDPGLRVAALGSAAVLALAATLAAGGFASAAEKTPSPVGQPPATQAEPQAEPQVGSPAAEEPLPPLDPELSAPLVPLSEFDVQTQSAPVQADQGEPEIPMVRYTLTVEGLGGTDLAARFRAVSVLQEHRNDSATTGQIQAWSKADTELLQRLFQSEGYYDGAADVSTTETPGDPSRLQVSVTGAPGERYSLDQIAVSGPDTRPPGLPRDALPLKAGDAIIATAVQGAEANVALRLPQEGYPFVKLGPRDVVLDERDHTGDYTLPVDPGPRSSFGRIRLDGEAVFPAEHVGVIARFKEGELYDERRVDDLRQALVATGLFSSVGVQPVRTDRSGPDDTTAADLVVTGGKAPPRSIAGSVGYGTGEGAKLEASWTHRNLFPPEGALILKGVAGSQEQRLGATFRRSNAGKRDRTFQVLAEGSRERREKSYDATSLTLSARLSRDSTPIWRKTWTWSAGPEFTISSESAREDAPMKTYVIAALPAQVGYDRSDDLLNPTRGFRLAYRVSPEASFRGGTATYVRNLFDGSAYLPVGGSTVLAGRVRLGSIVGADRDTLAPSRRLYSGGGGSVRGFGFRELGPLDRNGERIGGRSLFEAAFEARYRFGDFGIVPFVDMGQAYVSTLPKFSDIRFGAGIGARYYTNFGPMRIDVATPLGRRAGEPRVAVYISIGQAF